MNADNLPISPSVPFDSNRIEDEIAWAAYFLAKARHFGQHTATAEAYLTALKAEAAELHREQAKIRYSDTAKPRTVLIDALEGSFRCKACGSLLRHGEHGWCWPCKAEERDTR